MIKQTLLLRRGNATTLFLPHVISTLYPSHTCRHHGEGFILFIFPHPNTRLWNLVRWLQLPPLSEERCLSQHNCPVHSTSLGWINHLHPSPSFRKRAGSQWGGWWIPPHISYSSHNAAQVAQSRCFLLQAQASLRVTVHHGMTLPPLNVADALHSSYRRQKCFLKKENWFFVKMGNLHGKPYITVFTFFTENKTEWKWKCFGKWDVTLWLKRSAALVVSVPDNHPVQLLPQSLHPTPQCMVLHFQWAAPSQNLQRDTAVQASTLGSCPRSCSLVCTQHTSPKSSSQRSSSLTARFPYCSNYIPIGSGPVRDLLYSKGAGGGPWAGIEALQPEKTGTRETVIKVQDKQ